MKLITSFWTVIIISVSVALIFLSFGLFHEWKPNTTQAGYNKDLADKLQTEANKMPQAKKRQEKAIQIVNQKTSLWNDYVLTRTPPQSVNQGGIDVSVDPYTLSRNTWKFKDSIQKAVNAQLKKGGVKLVGSGPEIPAPSDINNVGGLLASYYHYPGIKFPVVIYNLGQIQVTGTYGQIMDHIRAYKSMPNYLAVTDGLRLDGTAPLLTGTYNLSIVGFVRGKKVFGAIPEDASTGSAGGGFGGGGSRGGRPGGGMMGVSGAGAGPSTAGLSLPGK